MDLRFHGESGSDGAVNWGLMADDICRLLAELDLDNVVGAGHSMGGQLLARAAGSRGMVGGQALDLAATGSDLDIAQLEDMHIHKTGALIRASVVLGYGADKVRRLLAAKRRPIRVDSRFNPFYGVADNLVSCWMARDAMSEDFVLINGDTLFEPAVLQRLLEAPPAPVTLAVDRKARYDADDMSGKADCKAALQRELGLPQRPGVALLGVVGRLTHQKGFDVLARALDRKRQYREALRSYRAAATFSPGNPQYHLGLAVFYEKQGKKSLARQSRLRARRARALGVKMMQRSKQALVQGDSVRQICREMKTGMAHGRISTAR